MKHEFRSYYRLRNDSFTFYRFDECINIEYRRRLKVFDLIYYPDKSKRKVGNGRFIRVVKYRSPDFLTLCGIVVEALNSADDPLQVEKILLELIPETPCA